MKLIVGYLNNPVGEILVGQNGQPEIVEFMKGFKSHIKTLLDHYGFYELLRHRNHIFKGYYWSKYVTA
jgi:hypothetical protein